MILWTHWFVAVVLVKLVLPERKHTDTQTQTHTHTHTDTHTHTHTHSTSKNMVKFLKVGPKKTQCLCAGHTFHILKYNSVFVERVFSPIHKLFSVIR